MLGRCRATRSRWCATFMRGAAGGGSGVAPDALGGAHDQLELRALGVRGDLVALEGRGEAALRGERQPLERDHPRRGVEAPRQLVLALKLRAPGGAEPG